MEKEDPEKEKEKEEEASDNVLDKTSELYQWWNRLSTINADDPFLVGGLKIGIRIIGVLILLALSPFIILGLLMGILAAG